MPWRSGGALVLSILAASLAACTAEEKPARGPDQPLPGEASSARPRNLDDTRDDMVPPDTAPAWTAGIVEGEGEDASMAYLIAVRFGSHGTYDRAVEAPNRYRVQVLRDPARQVVDIRHRD